MQIRSDFHNFSIRTWWTSFFVCLLEVKRILKQWTKWLELILRFCPNSKRYLCSELQMSQQDASASVMRYWFRGEPNLQFSENMFLLYFQTPEQAVHTNKAKALGWRYRVDLTLYFFTYREKQIVDYNCSMLAVGVLQFCVFCRRNVEDSLSAVFISWWWPGQRPETKSHLVGVLRSSLGVSVVITDSAHRITKKTSSDEARRRKNEQIRPEWIHA